MIAKVPGDKKNFMGDHLELVCLFQAAEIERLCEFLEDFRQKYIWSDNNIDIDKLKGFILIGIRMRYK